jgi:hypothetical protein
MRFLHEGSLLKRTALHVLLMLAGSAAFVGLVSLALVTGAKRVFPAAPVTSGTVVTLVGGKAPASTANKTSSVKGAAPRKAPTPSRAGAAERPELGSRASRAERMNLPTE